MVPWCGAVTGHRVRRGSVRAQHGEWRQAQSTAGHGHGSSEHREHYGHVTRDHAGERDAARDTAGHAGHRHHRYVTVTVRTVCTCKCCDMRTFCKLHRITETLLPHAAPVQCNYIIYPQLGRCPPRAGRWCSPSPRAASTCPGPRPPWQTRTPSPGKQSQGF